MSVGIGRLNPAFGSSRSASSAYQKWPWIGSKGWVGRAGARSGAGRAPRLDEAPPPPSHVRGDPLLSARARPPLSPRGPAVPRVVAVVPSSLPSPRPRGDGAGAGGRARARAQGRRVQPRAGRSGGNPRAPGGGGPGHSGGAGGGGDSGREPGPSRGSPQLRRASRPLPGSPAGRRRGVFLRPRPPPSPSAGSGVPGVRGFLRVGGSPAGCAPRAAVSRAAPRLGRRLAADLELVRTRGIRLFN